MHEAQAAAQHISDTLKATAGVAALVAARVYDTLAPRPPRQDFILYTYQGGRDQRAIGSNGRVLSRLRFLVRGVTPGNLGGYAAADAIAHQIDAALEDALTASLTLGGIAYRVQTDGRESPVRYVEEVRARDGKGVVAHYYHSGGIYSVLVVLA